MRRRGLRFAIPLAALALLSGVAARPCGAQHLLIRCDLQVGAETHPSLVFGMSRTASSGWDDSDKPAPPAAPGQVLYAYLEAVPAAEDLPNRWWTEVRPFGSFLDDPRGTHVELWRMTVATGAPYRLVTFSVQYDYEEAPPLLLALRDGQTLVRYVGDGDTFTVVAPSAISVFTWELTYDRMVPTAAASWGGVKALFH